MIDVYQDLLKWVETNIKQEHGSRTDLKINKSKLRSCEVKGGLQDWKLLLFFYN